MANPAVYPVSHSDSSSPAAELLLNSWSVPVAITKADLSVEEIGERARGAEGTLALSRIAQKETGDFSTPYWDPESIKALRGLVQGRGDSWRFDSSLYSGKGSYPTTSVGARYRLAERIISTDGTTTFENMQTIPKFGTGCICVDAGTRNRTPAGLDDGTSGFTGDSTINANQAYPAAFSLVEGAPRTTPSADLTKAFKVTWTGTKSLSFDPLGGAFANLQSYCISFYMLGVANGLDLTTAISYEDDTGGYSKPITLSSSRWTRVCLKWTPSTSGGHTNMKITISATADITFALTGIQCEAAVGTATAWHAWRPHAESDDEKTTLTWNLGGFDPGCDVTIAGWFRFSDASLAALLAIKQNGVGLTVQWGGGTIGFGSATAAVAAWAGWTHIAIVTRQNPLGGSYAREIWINGTLSGHHTATPPTFDSGAGAVQLTLDGGSAGGNFELDDLIVVPYGMPSDQIAALADRTSAWPQQPWLEVAGEFMGQTGTITCAGKAGRVGSAVGKLSGQPIGLVQSLPFTLTQR